jgi:hypothetical protein
MILMNNPWSVAMFLKMSHICSLMCKCLYMILTCFSGFTMLNLWLDSYFIDHMGPKAHFPSLMFSPLALSCGGA